MLDQEKSALRRSILTVLRGLDPAVRVRKSAAIASRLVAQKLFVDAVEVLGFYPMSEEVDVLPILRSALEAGKRVWLPRIEAGRLVFHRVEDLGTGMERHSYGMREPDAALPAFVPEDAAGFVLVVTPGVAFDSRGNRLGRGKGYYDSFLRSARAASKAPILAVAVAYAEQLVAGVPHGRHDETVDAVATDRELITLGRP